jgi:hypothetical protein
MSQLNTNDLRVLVLMLGGSPTLVNNSDTELLYVIQHEVLHLVVQGKFKAFYDTMPVDIVIKFFTDKRVLQFMVENAKAFMDKPKQPTLAERLERGVYADIWLPSEALWPELNDRLKGTQEAMLEAAALLRKHGLDK